MKKLLTLAIGLIMANISVNAQNCNFTYQQDPSTGTYYFAAPFFSDTNNTIYTWSFENGNAYGFGPYATHNYSQSMTDVVTLFVYGIDSTLICTSSQTIQVVVDTIPASTCPIFYSYNPSDLNTITFSVPGSNYPSTWNFGDSTVTTGFEVSHTFPGPGNYLVCMNITGGGFVCDDCVNVTVFGDTIVNPVDCNANFYASTSALVGYFIPTGYNNNDTYSWTFGDGSSSTEMYPYHTYNEAGVYDVCLTVTNESCFENFCQQVIIPESNVIPGDSSCNAYYVVSQENPFEVSVVNLTSGNDLTFNWTISSGLITISATGAYPEMNIESTGNFVLCLTVSNANGCSSTYCDSIVVGENGMIGGKVSAAGFVINVVSPQTLTGYEVAGINDHSSVTFNTYPNPFTDVLTISAEGTSIRSFEIFSVDGKKVMQGAINGNVETVNTSTLNKGIYMLGLVDNNGARTVKKIVKN